MLNLIQALANYTSSASGTSRRGRRAPPHGVSRRWRPTFEALESRAMLSTLTVLNNLDSGPGSLRAEIAAAQNGDTIVFAPSLNGQTIALSGGELSITKSVNIEGPGASELTVSGTASVGGNNYFSRVFEVNATQPVTISGLSIADGHGGQNGGAIFNHTALTINNCNLSGSDADYGGAIDNVGTMTISDSGVYSNLATESGGGAIENSGTMIVSSSSIDSNSAVEYGGGIRNLGTLTVSNSNVSYNNARVDGGGIDNEGRLNMSTNTLAQNSARIDGGGIYMPVGGASATLTGCTLSGNSATLGTGGPGDVVTYGGGGLYDAAYPPTTLTNCTLASNTARYGYGGGINFVGVGSATVLNCTIALNSAYHGGGISKDYVSSGRYLYLANSIVAENRIGDIWGGGGNIGADHNLVGNGALSGIANGVNGNIVGGLNGQPAINPMLGPLANNGGPTETMALLVGSPAIGQADNAAAPATDQRGVTRRDVPGELTDIGAFEL